MKQFNVIHPRSERNFIYNGTYPKEIAMKIFKKLHKQNKMSNIRICLEENNKKTRYYFAGTTKKNLDKYENIFYEKFYINQSGGTQNISPPMIPAPQKQSYPMSAPNIPTIQPQPPLTPQLNQMQPNQFQPPQPNQMLPNQLQPPQPNQMQPNQFQPPQPNQMQPPQPNQMQPPQPNQMQQPKPNQFQPPQPNQMQPPQPNKIQTPQPDKMKPLLNLKPNKSANEAKNEIENKFFVKNVNSVVDNLALSIQEISKLINEKYAPKYNEEAPSNKLLVLVETGIKKLDTIEKNMSTISNNFDNLQNEFENNNQDKEKEKENEKKKNKSKKCVIM